MPFCPSPRYTEPTANARSVAGKFMSSLPNLSKGSAGWSWTAAKLKWVVQLRILMFGSVDGKNFASTPNTVPANQIWFSFPGIIFSGLWFQAWSAVVFFPKCVVAGFSF